MEDFEFKVKYHNGKLLVRTTGSQYALTEMLADPVNLAHLDKVADARLWVLNAAINILKDNGEFQNTFLTGIKSFRDDVFFSGVADME